MNEQVHQRAQELIAKQRVESVSSGDQLWLKQHLAECPSCAADGQRTNDALSALRTINIDVPRNLAGRTQLRVRMRAEELREHGPASRLIWAVAMVSWIFGMATAPFVWRGFAWLGDELHLPKVVWAAGVVLWWAVPALVATGIVLLDRKGRAGVIE
jgi:hypothetical protein